MLDYLPTDIHQFAKKVVWYECPERHIRNEQEYLDFLVFLLAKMPQEIIDHAKEAFSISDANFCKALKTAKPGVFMYEDAWEKCNEKLGISPSLPFPRKTWITN